GFRDISHQSGSFFSRRQVGRGAAFGDYDNDGDTDVLIACNNQPAILLRNDSPQRHQWIRLALEGAGCNRDALGTRVQVKAKITVADKLLTQTQVMRSGTSYMADHDRRLVFGIGKAQQAPVEVKWPCGAVQKLTAAAGTTTAIKEIGCKIHKRAKRRGSAMGESVAKQT
ncbi:MAG TPA: CRTAC1 family protein, partial [Abditibacteriaceae bacterium]|nr:CRTAC1 family protein [Abditibacteriaceae bacterium]